MELSSQWGGFLGADRGLRVVRGGERGENEREESGLEGSSRTRHLVWLQQKQKKINTRIIDTVVASLWGCGSSNLAEWQFELRNRRTSHYRVAVPTNQRRRKLAWHWNRARGEDGLSWAEVCAGCRSVMVSVKE